MLHFGPEGMPLADRVLVVEESGVVAAALRAQLVAAGLEVDVVPAEQALPALQKGHALAEVRAERPDLAAALKATDPTLSVALLFRDDDALAARPAPAANVDGVLVGPLAAPVVASTARALARLSAQQRRLAELERLAGAARQTFEFHRRLVLMEVKRARRYRYPLAVALAAVDGWREVGASLGPGGRAKLLGELLGLLARSLRTVDLPVLHSEERFLVLMPHTPADGALVVANRLCQRVAAREGTPRVGVSVGVACFEGHGAVSLGSLLSEAARGLERARALGGGRAERGPTTRPEKKVDFGW